MRKLVARKEETVKYIKKVEPSKSLASAKDKSGSGANQPKKLGKGCIPVGGD